MSTKSLLIGLAIAAGGTLLALVIFDKYKTKKAAKAVEAKV